MRHRSLVPVLTAISFLALSITPTAYAEDGWTCGAWASDPSGKCEEVRTCTRRTCRDIQDLTSCTSETRKECANPKPPPKPTRFNSVAPPAGGRATTTDPGNGPGDATHGPLNGTYGAQPPAPGSADTTAGRVIGCTQEGDRIIVVNTTAQIIPQGWTIRWKLLSGTTDQTLVPITLVPGASVVLTTLPPAEWRQGTLRCHARAFRARNWLQP